MLAITETSFIVLELIIFGHAIVTTAAPVLPSDSENALILNGRTLRMDWHDSPKIMDDDSDYLDDNVNETKFSTEAPQKNQVMEYHSHQILNKTMAPHTMKPTLTSETSEDIRKIFSHASDIFNTIKRKKIVIPTNDEEQTYNRLGTSHAMREKLLSFEPPPPTFTSDPFDEDPHIKRMMAVKRLLEMEKPHEMEPTNDLQQTYNRFGTSHVMSDQELLILKGKLSLLKIPATQEFPSDQDRRMLIDHEKEMKRLHKMEKSSTDLTVHPPAWSYGVRITGVILMLFWCLSKFLLWRAKEH